VTVQPLKTTTMSAAVQPGFPLIVIAERAGWLGWRGWSWPSIRSRFRSSWQKIGGRDGWYGCGGGRGDARCRMVVVAWV
jgi:hypothetical protein